MENALFYIRLKQYTCSFFSPMITEKGKEFAKNPGVLATF